MTPTTKHQQEPNTSLSTWNVQRGCLVVGLLVGVLVHMSAFGSSIVLLAVAEKHHDLTDNIETELMECIFWWTVISTVTGLAALVMVRSLLAAVFRYALGVGSPMTEEEIEETLEDLMEVVDKRMIVGISVGVCASWTVNDLFLLLGMGVQYRYCALLLIVVLYLHNAPTLAASQDSKREEEREDKYQYVVLV
jgi:hypothetical protein